MSDPHVTDSPAARPVVACSDLLGWLGDKLKDAEKSLKCREEMAFTWRGGTDKSWNAAGCKLTKSQRLAQADTHSRIAVKCRREVSMFKAVIERLSHPNNIIIRN